MGLRRGPRVSSRTTVAEASVHPFDWLSMRVHPCVRLLPFAVAAALSAQEGQMDGYLGAPQERVDESYGGGYSMHVAAWPLLAAYPGNRFQTGLFGTWMHANVGDDKEKQKLYSDIEGGLGWWRDTRFATTTPKFIMGGVALDFSMWANGPGAGKGRDWSKPLGKYGVAQLSPFVVWPPDGLNLKQGVRGELFGYGYLPLPLAEAKQTTAGKDVPTGDQCWTLFLDTDNFKGPVAFFTPFFFSEATVEKPQHAGLFLDSRPANPNRALQMETQYVPAVLAKGEGTATQARTASVRFPVGADGRSTLVHRIRSYRTEALWPALREWFDGGAIASGRIDEAQSVLHTFAGKGWSTWRIHDQDVKKEDRGTVVWQSLAESIADDPHTFGYRWNATSISIEAGLAHLPQWWAASADGKVKWSAAPPDVSKHASLVSLSFEEARESDPEPYVTPDDGCWQTPGPVAGPFRSELGDGSVITYSWWRFADQPALQNADMSKEERERMQQRVELLHRHWAKDRSYLPGAAIGALAALDPGVLVTPPKGCEVGYVPIVTRQEKQPARRSR